jgi:DNA invertase Pin-like site-specific DNA recombinase
MKKYVAYYRVSTAKQGHSGLGLEAQRTAVSTFVGNATILREYVEVESGKVNERPHLVAAIDYAKGKGATLVIAKLDRLSRNAGFIFALKDSGVDFQCADMPEANTLTIGIFATLAQHERELISSRTRAALQAKKKQGLTWSDIAATLNKSGFRTARGKQFQVVQVQRIFNRAL